MRIVLASEVYPPRAGGAGWSTRALALGPARGRPRRDGGDHEPGAGRPRRPRRPPADRARAGSGSPCRAPLPRALAAMESDVVHAQHSLSALGALVPRPPVAGGGDRARPLAGLLLVHAHQPGRAVPRVRARAHDALRGRPRARARARWPGRAIPYMGLDLALKRARAAPGGGDARGERGHRRRAARGGHPAGGGHPERGGRRGGARARPRRRRRSRCPSASCSTSASSRRTRARGCSCPRWPRPRTGLPLVVLGEGTLAHALKFDAAAAGRAAGHPRLGGARGRAALPRPRHRAGLPLAVAGAAVARAAGGPGPGHAGGGHGHRRHPRDPGRRTARAARGRTTRRAGRGRGAPGRRRRRCASALRGGGARARARRSRPRRSSRATRPCTGGSR